MQRQGRRAMVSPCTSSSRQMAHSPASLEGWELSKEQLLLQRGGPLSCSFLSAKHVVIISHATVKSGGFPLTPACPLSKIAFHSSCRPPPAYRTPHTADR
ncbi:hypothetical protein EYF80_039588 [Liparis tanakae]|uniref:Uncharacterized protein n=1 Tax=Liparis tanakae TaxID=230148 RepID=A0A4Z2G9I5_9TELE|nr:hypothetical protein EYF80_039588 [Liparis tanakae]